MANFTVKTLDNLPPAQNGKRETYHDEKVKGLTLRITDKGVKSFVIRKRIDGKPKMHTLGHYPEMTISQAREAARKSLNSFSVGINPNDAKKDKLLKSTTLEQTLDFSVTEVLTSLPV